MKFTKAILQIARLNDLREIARSCNIKSPTTKRKQQLIDEIINAQNGIIGEQPSNRGRKPLSRIFDFNKAKSRTFKINTIQLIMYLSKLQNEYIEKINQLFDEYKNKIKDLT